MASAARRPEGVFGIQSARGSPDWPSASIDCRLACRNSSVLRSLRRGNERNITESLADRFWADDALLAHAWDHDWGAHCGFLP